MSSKISDFSDVPIVDTHVHGPMTGRKPGALFGLSPDWYSDFAKTLMPEGSTDRNLEREKLKDVVEQFETRPSSISRFHYLRKSYRFSSTGKDDVEKRIVNKIQTVGIKRYAEQAFSRERIKWVLVDHTRLTNEPRSDMAEFPDEKKKWTHPIALMLQPYWAIAKKAESAIGVAQEIDADLEMAKTNGCSGLKSTQAYFRDFSLEDVDEDEANRALRMLKKCKPQSHVEEPVRFPVYGRQEERESLKKYQDFLLKRIFCKSGELKMPVLIHTAVSVNPKLKPWLNDPSKLYTVFDNNAIRRANTKFLLIHTGYPMHHAVSALISQYPNVYTDLSHYSKDLAYLNTKILSEFLSISSYTKVMHGSDGSHPDIMCYAAHNTRIAVSHLADWLYNVEHWSRSEVYSLAEHILHKNAESLFGK
ncbi:MAG: amidohydrolase family protein [Nitrososphaerota archaeon]|nr:amidohydrolase family protein [Nitrososphaerota archaeon]